MRSIQGRVLGLIFVALLLPESVPGAMLEVTNTDDSGPGSLREKITESNATPAEADTITFSFVQNQSITLLSGYPEITGDLDIDGAGIAGITLIGQGTTLPANDDLVVESGTTAIRQIDLVDFWVQIKSGQTLILDSGADGMSFGELDGDPRTGNLSGSGTLIKQGSGTLQMFFEEPTLVPLFDGTLNIEEGAVRTDTASIGSTTAIDNAGELILIEEGTDQFNDIRVLGATITGSGSLVKEGDGATVALTGVNTFSGGIKIEGGGVVGSTDSLGSGGITFAPTSAEEVGLGIIQDTDGTLQGGVSGDGNVFKQGAGMVTLDGTNDYSGLTAILEGGLVIHDATLPGGALLSADTSIAFDQASDGSVGSISGPASSTLEKLGAANLTLSGDSPSFLGTTTVSAGGLFLDGIDFGTSAIDVQSAGTLGGTGTIAGSATVSGMLDPGGDGLGTLTFDGTVDLSSSAVLKVMVQSDGQSDRLEVNDVLTVDDSEVQLGIGSGSYATPVIAVIVDSTDPIVGGFSGLTEDLAFLDISEVAGDDTNVTVRIAANENTFAEYAETPNQAAIAGVLDDVGFTTEGDMQTVMDALSTLTVPEVPGALDSLAGEQLTSFSTPRIAAQRRLGDAMDYRMRGFAAGAPATLPPELLRPRISMSGSGLPMASLAILSASAPVLSTAPEAGESGFGAWLDGYGVLGHIDGGKPKDVDYDVFGASGGVDYRFGRRFLVGGAFGYAYTDIDLDHLKGTQHIDTYQGALYGTWATERLHIGASGGFGYSEMKSRRPIVFADLARKAKADFDGWSGSTHVEVGYDVFSLWSIHLQPLATFDFLHLEQDSFTEKNAGAADLKMKSDDLDSIVSGLGFLLHSQTRSGRGTEFTPNLHARWVHEYGDTKRRANLTLTGASEVGAGGTFQVKGADIGRDALAAGIGYTVSLRGGLHLYANYDVLWNPDVLEHGFGGGFQFAW